jgi:hypothetical protein
MKNAPKVLVTVCLAVSLASFRIPLNNHGYLLHLIWKEHLQEMWSSIIFVTLSLTPSIIKNGGTYRSAECLESSPFLGFDGYRSLSYFTCEMLILKRL